MFLLIILFTNRYLAMDYRVSFGITARWWCWERNLHRINDCGEDILSDMCRWCGDLLSRMAIVEIETTRNVPRRLLSLNRISPFLVCPPFPPPAVLHPSVRRCAYSPSTLREFPPYRTLRAYICIRATHIRTSPFSYGLITSCIATLRCTIREIKRRDNFDDAVMIWNY